MRGKGSGKLNLKFINSEEKHRKYSSIGFNFYVTRPEEITVFLFASYKAR